MNGKMYALSCTQECYFSRLIKPTYRSTDSNFMPNSLFYRAFPESSVPFFARSIAIFRGDFCDSSQVAHLIRTTPSIFSVFRMFAKAECQSTYSLHLCTKSKRKRNKFAVLFIP